MRLKRKVTILAALWTLLMTSQVYADSPGDFLIRNYTIVITVNCIEDAFAELGTIPGIVIESSLHSMYDLGTMRPVATMRRRVNNRDVESALESLHQLGRVPNSGTRTRNVFSDIMSLRSELQVRNNEYDRLMELLQEVATLEDFTSVENRLVEVIRHRERIQGRLNHYEFETNTSLLFIELFEGIVNGYDEEEPEPFGALDRIGRTFVNSAEFTLEAVQGFILILTYMSIPLVFFAITGLCIWRLVSVRVKIRKEKEKVTKEDTVKEVILEEVSEEPIEQDTKKNENGEVEDVENETESKPANKEENETGDN